MKHDRVDIGDAVTVKRVRLVYPFPLGTVPDPGTPVAETFWVPGTVAWTGRDGLGIAFADGTREAFPWWDKRWKRVSGAIPVKGSGLETRAS